MVTFLPEDSLTRSVIFRIGHQGAPADVTLARFADPCGEALDLQTLPMDSDLVALCDDVDSINSLSLSVQPCDGEHAFVVLTSFSFVTACPIDLDTPWASRAGDAGVARDCPRDQRDASSASRPDAESSPSE